jgi:hypothetical protein
MKAYETKSTTRKFEAGRALNKTPHSKCVVLPVTIDKYDICHSYWLANELEMFYLRQGGAIRLSVYGSQPVVCLCVLPDGAEEGQPV